MLPALRLWPLALIALLALALRTIDLADRPMHADEANQAVKTGELLETGRYTFDPRDHHGPTLYYLALPVAWIRGEYSLAGLSETTVRLVPALFGTLAVLLTGALAAPLGRWAALAAALFVALSPPAVYYSRYFIQETVLVTFTLAALAAAQRWWHSGRLRWAILAGIAVGLMQATKASAPLFVVAALVAAGVVVRTRRPGGSQTAEDRGRMAEGRGRITEERERNHSGVGPRSHLGTFQPETHNGPRTQQAGTSTFAKPTADRPAATPRHWHLPLATAAIATAFTAATFFTSFGTNFAGLRDAIAVYTHAGARLTAGVTGHEKAADYYVQLFLWHRAGGLLWQQVAFFALAVIGLGAAWSRLDCHDDSAAAVAHRWLRGAAIYTLIVLGALSLSAYKTPWHVVHLVPAFALLVAGTLGFLSRLRFGPGLAIAATVLVAGTLAHQTRLVAFQRPADARNPYAYVHSAPDVKKFRAVAEAALAQSPGEPVRIIADEYWPLPWYLRGLPRVGYWSAPPDDCDGALVVTTASLADTVRSRLRGEYQESFLGLRPGVVCVLFTAKR